MTTFKKLQKRILEDLDLDLRDFRRTYAGHWQRSQGAWVWTATLYVDGQRSPVDMGSPYRAHEVLAAKKIDVMYGKEILIDE